MENKLYSKELHAITLIFMILFHLGCEQSYDIKLDGLQVSEGFTIERAVLSANLLDYPMFATFDDDGNLYVCESTAPNVMETDSMLAHPSYQIRYLQDTDGDHIFDRSTIFADSLPFPMGGVFYQGSFYSAVSPNLMKFTDHDGDGVADEREVILSGWTLNANGAILSGPFLSPDGYFYLADARRGFKIVDTGGQIHHGRGARIWRCRPDGSELEWISGGGFDNAIEVVFTPEGETIGTMTYFTDPKNGERDALMHWIEGGVYPKAHAAIKEDNLPRTGPLMPVMTKLPRVAPSGLMRYQGRDWGPDYTNDLFLAEFNTGRIMRHKLNRLGASFNTLGQPFICAYAPDIHPTDVLQSADGSVLVVTTGGWFIKGCPLSRVAKPELPGGIYRIRKKDQEDKDDPWGQNMVEEKCAQGKLASYLIDERWVVRKKAGYELIDRGDVSIGTIDRVLSSVNDPTVRCELIFLLYQFKRESVLPLLRQRLLDSDYRVRIAAAHCLGLRKDRGSTAELVQLLKDVHPAVRRHAATALGQISSEESVEMILSTLEDPQERVVEHAIIFALIQIGQPGPLLSALSSASPEVRKAALIALDQINDGVLGEDQLIPFLSSGHASDREVATWIASGHPSWSKSIGTFLRQHLEDIEWNDEEGQHLRQLLDAFASHEEIQEIIADRLTSPSILLQEKMFLLQIMRTASLHKFPNLWIDGLKYLLTDEREAIKLAVLEVIESRALGHLNDRLTRIIKDVDALPTLRIKALAARLRQDATMSKFEFGLLRDFLGADQEMHVRQKAVQLLSNSPLTEDQCLTIANRHLLHIDAFLVPGLLDILGQGMSDEVGHQILRCLRERKDWQHQISIGEFSKLIGSYSNRVQEEATPLGDELARIHDDRLSRLTAMEEKFITGDVGVGRSLFYGKALCSTCHAVGGHGSDFGPDLSNIGEIRSRHDLLEAIVYPSASFAREYETYHVQSGSTKYTGIIDEYTSSSLVLHTAPGNELRLSPSDVDTIETGTTSLMPPGLDQQLNQEELNHLLTFLEALPYRLDRLIEINTGD